MKKFLLPVGAGVVVFGVVTAFAASLNLTSPGLSAGNATVAACNNSAAASYTTGLAAVGGANAGKYVVTAATVTTGAGCASKAYKVSLTDSTGAVVGSEMTGTLTAAGTAAITYTGDAVLAESVTGIAVVITG